MKVLNVHNWVIWVFKECYMVNIKLVSQYFAYYAKYTELNIQNVLILHFTSSVASSKLTYLISSIINKYTTISFWCCLCF